jgi:hypothetical protein
MAVTPQAVTAAIIAASPALKGPAWFQTCVGIGIGVVAWSAVPINVVMVGSVNGTLGGGAVTGKFVLPPVPAPVVASVAAGGLVGLSAPQIGAAVGLGIGTAYSASGQYIGQSVGAIGVDASKVVVANPATLTPSLIAGFAAQGLIGPAALQLAAALSPGIATMFLTGFGTGVAAGPTGPSPGTGISRSSII